MKSHTDGGSADRPDVQDVAVADAENTFDGGFICIEKFLGHKGLNSTAKSPSVDTEGTLVAENTLGDCEGKRKSLLSNIEGRIYILELHIG